MITWRPLVLADFPLLRSWLEQPYVARWWNHETSDEALDRDFGLAVRGLEPAEMYLALWSGQPFGLVQRYRIEDFPEYVDELAAIVDVPPGAMSMDYLIGEPAFTGRGVGTEMIRSMLTRSWDECPAATCFLIPVHADNHASWRALAKAGMRRVATGELEPDNPIDSRDHVIYRIDRA